MDFDLIGRVQNTRLRARHGLMPLFETVVNSIAAIEEAERSNGHIEITIERDFQQSVLDAQFNRILPVKNFIIEDNGIGFTEDNYASFDTMDSRAKAIRGGKGIGRLLWLKAFDYAEIESVYLQGTVWHRRKFEFRLTKDGIENHFQELVPDDASPSCPKTVVRLVSFRDNFRDATPKSADAIARRIVEHCMEYFLLGSSPTIVVIDPACDEQFDLHQLFTEEYHPISGSREFHVGDDRFLITDVLLKPTPDAQHRLHFCAHNRVVESLSLHGRIPHLDGPLVNEDGTPSMYSGYVTGPFLDERVDAQRTSFEFEIDRDGAIPFEGSSPGDNLLSTAIASASEYLEPLTAALREQVIQRVTNFVETKEPKYRALLNYRKEDIEKLQVA